MPGKNLETFRAAHQAFNARDLDTILTKVASTCTYHDRARSLTFKGPNGFREFMQSWITGFSNARISDPRYIDAGDTVIAQFVARGVNDGQFGDMPKTGKEVSVPFCEILRFDEQGMIVSGSVYYDQLTMLTQLGLAEQSAAASAGGAARRR